MFDKLVYPLVPPVCSDEITMFTPCYDGSKFFGRWGCDPQPLYEVYGKHLVRTLHPVNSDTVYFVL